MVIAICKTKEEDTDMQILVMQREGFPNADFAYADFAGFIGDETGANKKCF